MTDEMKTAAYRIAQRSLSKYSIEKDIAQFIKEEFDQNVANIYIKVRISLALHRR